MSPAAPIRLQFRRGTHVRMFLTALIVSMAGQLAGLDTLAAQPGQLSSWRGEILEVGRDRLRAKLDSGEVTVKLKKPGRGELPTTVLVSGHDHIQVLEPGMFVEFNCVVGDNGLPLGTILLIEARDEQLNPPGFLQLPNAVIVDPSAGDPPAANTRQIRVVGVVKKIDLNLNQVEVWYPGHNKAGAPRTTFPIDAQQTRVKFALTNLKFARPTDEVSIRGLASEDDAAITPVEIRIRRVNAFPVAGEEPLLDPLAQPTDLANSDPAAEPAEMANDEGELPGVANGEDGSGERFDAQLQPPDLPANLKNESAIEVFDFPKNQPSRTPEEKARRHYKIN